MMPTRKQTQSADAECQWARIDNFALLSKAKMLRNRADTLEGTVGYSKLNILQRRLGDMVVLLARTVASIAVALAAENDKHT